MPQLAGDARAQPILCRDLRLEGHELDPIHHETLPCGIAAPVRLERVDGVHLRPPARLTCGTARTLANWVSGVLRPASEAELGARPTHLRVVGSYACRTRNHQPGARISEHGFGRAIDIAGLTLSDGRSVSVATDWGNGPEGRLLARMHAGACGPFKTVLGPGSDAYHDDHFHFDTAARSGAAYCR
ncbi:MAG: extensin family protein [Pseudomonadota bacterium]